MRNASNPLLPHQRNVHILACVRSKFSIGRPTFQFHTIFWCQFRSSPSAETCLVMVIRLVIWERNLFPVNHMPLDQWALLKMNRQIACRERYALLFVVIGHYRDGPAFSYRVFFCVNWSQNDGNFNKQDIKLNLVDDSYWNFALNFAHVGFIFDLCDTSLPLLCHYQSSLYVKNILFKILYA